MHKANRSINGSQDEGLAYMLLKKLCNIKI